MYSSTPPYVLALLPLVLYYIPIFNTLSLVFSLYYWRRAEIKLLQKEKPESRSYSSEQFRAAMKHRRSNYFHSQDLPRFVTLCPIKLAVHRTRGPSLGPLLAVILVQCIPGVSLFVAFWYVLNGAIEVGRKTLEMLRMFTPSNVKNTLFTQWF